MNCTTVCSGCTCFIDDSSDSSYRIIYQLNVSLWEFGNRRVKTIGPEQSTRHTNLHRRPRPGHWHCPCLGSIALHAGHYTWRQLHSNVHSHRPTARSLWPQTQNPGLVHQRDGRGLCPSAGSVPSRGRAPGRSLGPAVRPAAASRIARTAVWIRCNLKKSQAAVMLLSVRSIS